MFVLDFYNESEGYWYTWHEADNIDMLFDMIKNQETNKQIKAFKIRRIGNGKDN